MRVARDEIRRSFVPRPLATPCGPDRRKLSLRVCVCVPTTRAGALCRACVCVCADRTLDWCRPLSGGWPRAESQEQASTKQVLAGLRRTSRECRSSGVPGPPASRRTRCATFRKRPSNGRSAPSPVAPAASRQPPPASRPSACPDMASAGRMLAELCVANSTASSNMAMQMDEGCKLASLLTPSLPVNTDDSTYDSHLQALVVTRHCRSDRSNGMAANRVSS